MSSPPRPLTSELRAWAASYRGPSASDEAGPSSSASAPAADSDESFSIYLKTLDNETTQPLAVKASMRVSELKLLAHPVTDVAPTRQRLFFRGRELRDEATLGSG